MPYCQSNGIQIYYEWINQDDTKPVIVLVTGLTGSVTGWSVNGFFQQLRRSSRYAILLIDNRGAGFSDAPEDAYTIGQMALDIIGVVDHLDLDTFHLYGVSMGGMIAQHVAARIPDRLSSLALSSTISDPKYLFQKAIKVIEKHRRGDYVDDWMMLTRYLMTEREFNEFESILRKLYTERLTNGYPIQTLHGYLNQVNAVTSMENTLEILTTFAESNIPTLLLFGLEDMLMKVEGMEEIQRVIPHATLRTYPNQGHGTLPIPITDYLAFLQNVGPLNT